MWKITCKMVKIKSRKIPFSTPTHMLTVHSFLCRIPWWGTYYRRGFANRSSLSSQLWHIFSFFHYIICMSERIVCRMGTPVVDVQHVGPTAQCNTDSFASLRSETRTTGNKKANRTMCEYIWMFMVWMFLLHVWWYDNDIVQSHSLPLSTSVRVGTRTRWQQCPGTKYGWNLSIYAIT